VLTAVALLATTAGPGAGQGWIEPGVDRGGFAVDRTRSEVRVRVEGRVAHFEVSEWFVNRGRRLAEGEYLYPLPGEAVFQGFSLFQGDAELRGEIMDAERAREIYEGIVRRHADPALIELAGQGLLRARVFPIQPGEERRVTLRYTQVLERAGSSLQLLYAGGVRGRSDAGPRPMDRRPMPLPAPVSPREPQIGQPQAHRPQVRQESVRTSFRVEVADGSRFLDPFSPTHTLDVERRGERLTISIDEEIRGRFALFLPLAGDAVGLSIATHRPVGEPGYFMLTLSPGRNSEGAEPRDVTVVLDVSGSMSGEKIEQAKDAVRHVLETLSPNDRFRLISFSSAVRAQSSQWSSARGAPLERARSWIDALVADGGTNIGGALDEAFRLESPRGRLPIVLFLTDGLPSVGEESPERLADIAEERAGRARVFAFGVGHDVNTHLLDRLGEAGRGDTDYVQPGENVERVISLLAAKIRHPVLTDLELVAGRVSLAEIYPVRIPDVFAGEELVLFGRFREDGQGALTVRGERGGRRVEFSTELTFPEASDANAYIPRLWASRRLGHLERQIWTEGESPSLVEEIRQLALRYGLPSRYTAYLVEEPGIVAGGPIGRGGGRALDFNRAPGAPAPTSGAEAVKAAESARGLRSASSSADLRRAEDEIAAQLVERDGTDAAKALGGRLFRLTEGVWTDVTHDPRKREVEVSAFSAAYFALLRALPEIEPVLSELQPVVIAGTEVTLRVGTAGLEEISTSELRELVAGFRGVDGN
jgi:Ca-activated chloride channel family protein